MALEQKLHLKLAQKLVMTPTLQQAIKLLQLSRLELEQALEQEIQVNPMLEMSEDIVAGEDAEAGEPEGEVSEISAQAAAGDSEEGAAEGAGEHEDETGKSSDRESYSEVELESLFSNYLHDTPSLSANWELDENSPFQNAPAPEASLYEALSRQLGLSSVPDHLRPVAEYLIGNLDNDGYLRIPLEEVSLHLGVAVEIVLEALAAVQALDPPGIGARSLQECFLLQLDRMDRRTETNGGSPLELTRRIVAESFDDLLHQRWEKLESRFGADRVELMRVTQLLRHLQPRPGSQLGPIIDAAVEPDVVVRRVGDQWRVTLNDDGMPRLRLSPQYIKLLRSRNLDSATTGYLRERMRSALWFLRSVDQRQNTVLRVAEAIVRRQIAFFDKGLTHLRPLVLRDIADDIGMHESTVSRVVTNKHMDTPRGVFPLKFFFHSAISHAISGDISSVVVKERIRELIADEDPAKPLSDARIARLLNRIGIRIARRTVAKYREEVGLASSEQRRRRLR